MDPITQVRTALLASAPVTDIVVARVAPLTKAQNITLPAITLQAINRETENALQGSVGTDSSRVQVTYWATTYDAVRALADVGRTAIASASRLFLTEVPDYDSEIEVYRISQDFSIWVDA